MTDKIAPLPEEQDVLDETPGAKALREAQERGEDVQQASEPKNAYEQLDELYSVGKPLILESYTGTEDHKVYVQKCKMKDMGKIIRFAKTVIAEVNKLREIDQSQDVDEVDQNDIILTLLANNLDEVFDLAFELCSIKERSDLDELNMDDGVELILAIIEVNKHFFIQKVLPLIQKVIGRST